MNIFLFIGFSPLLGTNFVIYHLWNQNIELDHEITTKLALYNALLLPSLGPSIQFLWQKVQAKGIFL